MPDGLDSGGSIAGGGNAFPEAEGNISFDPEYMHQQDADFAAMAQEQ